MRSAYVLFPVLCVVPLLPGCTSLGTTMASYGVSSMVKARHPNETPEMYYDVGRYYQAQNRWDSAARAYESALALRKDYVEAANALATCYAMQHQYDRAAAQLGEAIKLAPDAAYLRSNLGYVYYLQGKLPEAIAALEAATSAEPQNGRAWRNLAMAYGKAGAADKSRAAYARANRATPGALLESWKASHPVAEAGIAAREDSRTSATAPVAKAPVAASAAPTQSAAVTVAALDSVARSEASMEVVSVGKNTYELRVVPAAPVALAKPLAAPAAERVTVAKPFRVEVSNGNGTTGMARRVAHSLKQAGVNTVRLTNQMPWQSASEIQFSAGYAAEAAKLAQMLGQELLTIRNDKLRRDINVRLVLGKDIRDETAFATPHPGGASTRIASSN